MAQPITPCLWFPGNAEDAVNYYVSVFKEAQVVHVQRSGDGDSDSSAPAVYIDFQLNGQPFQAINGPDLFPFNESISLSVLCDTQDEVDYYWDRLTDGGEPGQCGWLKDRYGVSWQVVPRVLGEIMRHPDTERSGKAVQRMMQMQKLDIAELEAAFNG